MIIWAFFVFVQRNFVYLIDLTKNITMVDSNETSDQTNGQDC